MNEVNTAALESRFDAYLSELLSRSDQSGLSFAAFSDTLSQRDRYLLVIQNLDAQMGNGGFQQYQENGHLERDYAPLMHALGRLKAAVQGEALGPSPKWSSWWTARSGTSPTATTLSS